MDNQPRTLRPNVDDLFEARSQMNRQRQLAASIEQSFKKGKPQKAKKKVTELLGGIDRNMSALDSCLSSLQLIFSLLWLKIGASAGSPQKVHEEIRDVAELFRLFEIDELRELGHFENIEDRAIARQIIEKVYGDTRMGIKMESAGRVCDQLQVLIDEASNEGDEDRFVLLNLIRIIVANGMEASAVHHILPVVNSVERCACGHSHN